MPYTDCFRPPVTASRLSRLLSVTCPQRPPSPGGFDEKSGLVLHLLAMTADLAGFWKRLYPQVRRELSRRYPIPFLTHKR